ncbi:MAG: transcriptional repressor [Clostridiales bacterium]|nr:transcriptional repressor [Clostridiales bacterium]
MRYSRQRELITEIIKGRSDHPTADMIYSSAREFEPNISLGTVYRNLKLLTDEREIITLETEDKRLHYDGDTSRHSHFICSKCGKIIDLFKPTKTPDEIEELGLKVIGEKCVYYGQCMDCCNDIAE